MNEILIGCYYYAWYKNDWLKHTVRVNDPPLLGEYNNTIYCTAVHEHMKSLKKAGVDFISISYQREDHGHIIDIAKLYGIKVTYFYESLKRAEKDFIPYKNHCLILNDISEFIEYTQEDNWLKIDNRPVLMFYVTRCLIENPLNLFESIRKKFGDMFIVGDELFWYDVPDERIKMFDAVTAYNMYEVGRFSTESPAETCRTYLENTQKTMLVHALQASRLKITIWGNAMPGYDDSGVRPERKNPPIPRIEGEFFKRSLSNAIEISNISSGVRPCVMITSFGEWYEDTQIEEATSYKTMYLDILGNSK